MFDQCKTVKSIGDDHKINILDRRLMIIMVRDTTFVVGF